MALSIQQNANMKPVMHNQVENKGSQSSQYSDNDRNTAEQNLQNNAHDDKAKGSFDIGLGLLMSATLPNGTENTVLTGIAEMNAVGLQFFLAMQRQIVHLRLSDISTRNYPAEINH